MTIKQNIVSRMEQGSLTLTALSKKAGISLATLQNIIYEKSKSPTIHVLLAISDALGCSVSDLVDEESHTVLFMTQWDKDLYMSCLHCISENLRKLERDFTYEIIQTLIKQVYEFSIENNLKEADGKFCKWVCSRILAN